MTPYDKAKDLQEEVLSVCTFTVTDPCPAWKRMAVEKQGDVTPAVPHWSAPPYTPGSTTSLIPTGTKTW